MTEDGGAVVEEMQAKVAGQPASAASNPTALLQKWKDELGPRWDKRPGGHAKLATHLAMVGGYLGVPLMLWLWPSDPGGLLSDQELAWILLGNPLTGAVLGWLLGLAIDWMLWRTLAPVLLPEMVIQAHNNLIDRGLLLFTLEHYPRESSTQQPSLLTNLLVRLGVLQRGQSDISTMVERLAWTQEHYVQCCKQQDLKPYSRSIERLCFLSTVLGGAALVAGSAAFLAIVRLDWLAMLQSVKSNGSFHPSSPLALSLIIFAELWLVGTLPTLLRDLVAVAVKRVLVDELTPSPRPLPKPERLPPPPGYEHTLFRPTELT